MQRILKRQPKNKDNFISWLTALDLSIYRSTVYKLLSGKLKIAEVCTPTDFCQLMYYQTPASLKRELNRAWQTRCPNHKDTNLFREEVEQLTLFITLFNERTGFTLRVAYNPKNNQYYIVAGKNRITL